MYVFLPDYQKGGRDFVSCQQLPFQQQFSSSKFYIIVTWMTRSDNQSSENTHMQLFVSLLWHSSQTKTYFPKDNLIRYKPKQTPNIIIYNSRFTTGSHAIAIKFGINITSDGCLDILPKFGFLATISAQKWFPRVIQIHTKFTNFARLYFHVLQHLATKPGNSTNFRMLPSTVVKDFLRLA